MIRKFCLVALVLFASLAQAEVTIKAPETSPPNALVRVSTPTEGKSFLWDVLTTTHFVDFQEYSNGSACVFTGPPGRYLIRVVVLSEDGHLEQARAVVIIGTKPPGPDPDPDPEPDPDPQPDPVAKLSYQLAKALPSAAKANFDGVIKAYNTTIVGMREAQPGYATIQESALKLQAARAAAMGDPAAWSTWTEGMKPAWDKLWLEKPNKAQVVEFYKSVAAGLAAARGVAQRSK